MFQALGDDAEGENLGLGHRLVGSCTIRKDARQLRHFCQPSPIFLTLTFNAEVHGDLPHSDVPILPFKAARFRADGLRLGGAWRGRNQRLLDANAAVHPDDGLALVNQLLTTPRETRRRVCSSPR